MKQNRSIVLYKATYSLATNVCQFLVSDFGCGFKCPAMQLAPKATVIEDYAKIYCGKPMNKKWARPSAYLRFSIDGTMCLIIGRTMYPLNTTGGARNIAKKIYLLCKAYGK